jgi:hypothetical protein
MHGELAQLVALAAHGSAFVARTQDDPPPELFPESTVFRFTNSVEFRRRTSRLAVLSEEVLVGHACAPWYADLRNRDATVVRLCRSRLTPRNRILPSHIEAGFSGGLDVGILVRFSDRRRELWTGHWDVSEPNHPGQRIWRVRFSGVGTSARVQEGPEVLSAARRLEAALEASVSLVAGRRHFDYWENTFRHAKECLSSPAPVIPFHPDLLPSAGYSLDARRLLAAAASAWVFGGMGSWNDVNLVDDADYKSITKELFEAVMQAVVAATNAHLAS